MFTANNTIDFFHLAFFSYQKYFNIILSFFSINQIQKYLPSCQFILHYHRLHTKQSFTNELYTHHDLLHNPNPLFQLNYFFNKHC